MVIEPAGNKILIKRDKVEDHDPTYKAVKMAGLVIPETEDHLRRQAGMDRGKVMALGPTAFKDPYFLDTRWCEVGDFIVFPQYSGKALKNYDTDEDFIIINDADVVAILRGYNG
jgi:co-chaperonin GroES (HSP10)